jgi:hypothetical protein
MQELLYQNHAAHLTLLIRILFLHQTSFSYKTLFPYTTLFVSITMAQSNAPEGSPEYMREMQKKLAEYIETKRYIDEPEILPWYKKDLTEIKPPARELFEKYSHVSPAEVESHIKRIVRTSRCLHHRRSNMSTAR